MLHKEQTLGVVRHLLTVVGGYAVGRGYISSDILPEVIGITLSVIGVFWSIYSPDKQMGNGYDKRHF